MVHVVIHRVRYQLYKTKFKHVFVFRNTVHQKRVYMYIGCMWRDVHTLKKIIFRRVFYFQVQKKRVIKIRQEQPNTLFVNISCSYSQCNNIPLILHSCKISLPVFVVLCSWACLLEQVRISSFLCVFLHTLLTQTCQLVVLLFTCQLHQMFRTGRVSLTILAYTLHI